MLIIHKVKIFKESTFILEVFTEEWNRLDTQGFDETIIKAM